MARERPHPKLPRTLLALWAMLFAWLVFFFVPAQFIEMNEELGWPVWRTEASRALGVVTIVFGAALMIHCTGLFARIGGGTPIPAAPPERLVIAGPYRYSRNPIYVADVLVWLGIFLFDGSAALLLYAAIGTLLLQLVIVYWEEPVLERRHGSAYQTYRERVPRWLRLRPGRS